MQQRSHVHAMEYHGYNAQYGPVIPTAEVHTHNYLPPPSQPPPQPPPPQPPAPPQPTTQQPASLPAVLGFYNGFEFIDYANGKMKILGRCTHCSRMIAGQWRPERVTSNFITHLKHCSQAIYGEYEKKKDEQKRLGKRCRSDFPEVASIPQADKYARFTTDDYVERVALAVSRFVCLDVQPVSIVEKEGFKQLIQTLVPECPMFLTKDIVVNRILSLRQEVEHRVHQCINRASHCSLQVRIWSSNQKQTYLGICATYVDDRRVASVVLVCKRLLNSPLATEQIVGELCEVSTKYQFQEGRITAVIVEDSKIKNQSSQNKLSQDSGATNHKASPPPASLEGIDVGRIWREMVAISFTCPTPEFSCTAHLLELVVRDGLQEITPNIKESLARCAKSASAINQRYQIEFGKSLTDFDGFHWPDLGAYRWISQLGTISRIILQQDIKPNDVTMNADDFHEDDKVVLKELERLLKPLSNAIERLQLDEETTGSLLLPILIGVMRQIQAQQDVRFCCSIQVALLDSWHKRFADLLDIERGKTFILAAILDPRMKVKWVCEPNKHARLAAYKSALLEEMQQISTTNNMAISSPLSILPDAVIKLEMPDQQQDDLLSYLTESQDAHDHAPWPLKEELEAYLQDTNIAEPLLFWSDRTCRYPTLQKLHRKFHCVLATVAVSESRLHFTSDVTFPACPVTSGKLFETILFLKGNANLLR